MARALLVLLLLSAPTARAETTAPNVAYFSLEMASPALRGQRTGGLGVLAMDLVRGMARELVPRGGEVVGVTLLYDKAWAQRIDPHGNQSFDDVTLDPADWVKRGTLRFVTRLSVDVAGERHPVDVYEERLGKARILRLHAPGVSRMLYNGSREERLLQELILGKAGLAALKHIGAKPDILHLNESHTAFAGVFARTDRAFDRTRIVSTTHTPVEAGLERFETSDWKKIVDSGIGEGWRGHFERNGKLDLTQAMFKVSEIVNAVSDEHTEVMKGLYPDFADRLTSVQNGVDPEYWQHPSIRALSYPTKAEIWAVKQPLRQRFVDEVHKRTGVPLTLDKPIVAFTRRVTGYKNTWPLLKERLGDICKDRSQGGLGLQVVVAGVAHPADGEGQAWIKEMVEASQRPELRGRFVFVPDYLGPDNDLDLDRIAVQGADVWLTTPKHGLEASGTSDRRSLLNLGIQIWSPDTGGGRDYVVPFDEETGAGNGLLIAGYTADSLYDRLGRASKLFYGHTQNGDPAYLDLLANIRKAMDRVTIARNVKLQIERTYRPALQRGRIGNLSVSTAARSRRFDQPLPVQAELDVGDLDPKDLEVALVAGRTGRASLSQRMVLQSVQGGRARFAGVLAPFEGGEHEYRVRVAGHESPVARVVFDEDGLSEAEVDQVALHRWAAHYRQRIGHGLTLPSRSWTFKPEDKDQVVSLRVREPLVVENDRPFTLVSGPVGARDTLRMKAVKQGSKWMALLRLPKGLHWMTFQWHDSPEHDRWENRDYWLKVKGPAIRQTRSPAVRSSPSTRAPIPRP